MPPKYVKWARSVRFNVYLIIVIAVVASVGSFFPLEEFDVYHTWYFAGLLALMAFDVLVCKLQNFPKLIHGRLDRDKKLTVEHIKQSPLRFSFEANMPVEAVSQKLKRWFKLKKMTAHEGKAAEGVAFYAGRHRVQRWGDFVLHVSIVVILAGNLWGALMGFEEMVAVAEGETIRMKHRPYDVTLKDFDIEYYETNGAPSLYASDMTVSENGHVIGAKRIVVNEPLDINRVRFYQASWGMSEAFHSVRLHLAGGVMELKARELKKITGTPYSVRVNRFLPTFSIDAHGHAENINSTGKNLAVQVDFVEKEKTHLTLWLLKDQPETAYQERNGIVSPAQAPPPFFLIDVNPVLFSGIQVGYDPGAPLFWFGAIMLLIGLSMHFYLHQRRLRILVVKEKKGARLWIGGWNSRTLEDFKDEFEQWSDEIKASLQKD